jgi:hypothetical protein
MRQIADNIAVISARPMATLQFRHDVPDLQGAGEMARPRGPQLSYPSDNTAVPSSTHADAAAAEAVNLTFR